MILLDFSKAFDKVSHRQKLKFYGVRGNILDWITSFLIRRTQNVACGGCTSTPSNVLSGMPQGSVLGPLLFLVYIYDITQELSSICHLYADDCILYRRIDSFTGVRALQNDLKLLELWEKKWKMSFNIDKCMVVSVTLKQTPIPANYTLHGKQLTAVECAKYLGASIDSKLSFNQHVGKRLTLY